MDTVYFKYVSHDTGINKSNSKALYSRILQYLCNIEDSGITRLLGIAKRRN